MDMYTNPNRIRGRQVANPSNNYALSNNTKLVKCESFMDSISPNVARSSIMVRRGMESRAGQLGIKLGLEVCSELNAKAK